MLQNQTQLLIDRLDESRQGKGSSETEPLPIPDAEIAREWRYLNLAVDAVQEAGLYDQVGVVKSTWQTQQLAGTKPAGAVIHSIYRKVLRAASVILIISGGAALYKYTTTDAIGVYSKYYPSYSLNTSRSAGTEEAIDQAYTHKNWAEVVALCNTSKEKNNKHYFLAGMADLELKKYDDAIAKFQHIIAANALSGGDYFQDEAEFYLAMSWLGRGDANEAVPLLEKIKANKSHLYHDVVVKMSSLDLRIIQYKGGK